MTRLSKREIERILDRYTERTTGGERPEDLTSEEKKILAELFDVDPDAPGKSRGQQFLEQLHERQNQ